MSQLFSPARSSRMQFFGGPSVWLEFTPLARLTASINLGQGSPGWGSPNFVSEALVNAAQQDTYSQYAPPTGNASLLSEIARVYFPKVTPPAILNSSAKLDLDALVTNGASQAISLICNSLLDNDDEVILIEPSFDFYIGAVHAAGATPVYVPLIPKSESFLSVTSSADLVLDMDEFVQSLSPRTRMLILNSPHNPTGKVFSRIELLALADALDKHAPNCIVLSDEVYEHLVFCDGQVETKHVPFASVSETAHARTLSVYSAGKTFSATGLKTGWVIGSSALMRDLKLLQQFTVFCVCHVAQAAVADILQQADGLHYYAEFRDSYTRKRDFLVDALRKAGLHPIIPQGAFYICARVPEDHPLRDGEGKSGTLLPERIRELADSGQLSINERTVCRRDYNFSRRLVLEHGVASIPLSAFFCDEHIGKSELSDCVVRFAFCHPDEVLAQAAKRFLSPLAHHD